MLLVATGLGRLADPGLMRRVQLHPGWHRFCCCGGVQAERYVCQDGFRSRIGRLINAIGFKVIATARSEAIIEHLASLGYHAVQLDVTDAASIDACREIVVGLTGGRLDILMNNA